jgi:hypothetical protein
LCDRCRERPADGIDAVTRESICRPCAREGSN